MEYPALVWRHATARMGFLHFDQPAGAWLDGDDDSSLDRGNEEHFRRRDRRGNHLHRRVVFLLGIEIAKAPDFAAIIEAMTCDVITARHDQVSSRYEVPSFHRQGGSISLAAHGHRIGFALDLPDFLSGGLIHGNDPMPFLMQQHEVEPVVVQKGRVVYAVVDLELAVTLLSVEFPDFVPLVVVAGDVAGVDKAENVPAVGARRGGAVAGVFFRTRHVADLPGQ